MSGNRDGDSALLYFIKQRQTPGLKLSRAYYDNFCLGLPPFDDNTILVI